MQIHPGLSTDASELLTDCKTPTLGKCLLQATDDS